MKFLCRWSRCCSAGIPRSFASFSPPWKSLSIEVEVCRGVSSGQEILRTEKFDAIIVDCDDLKGALGVLEGLRKSVSNKNSVTFAILNGSTTTQQAFQMGANFVLQKPISALNAMRCFSAAVNFMMRERRRYFRHPVECRPHSHLAKAETEGHVTNLSEGGMAIFFRGPLPKGGVSTVSFKLPGAATALEPKSRLPGWTNPAALVFVSSKCPRNRGPNWTHGWPSNAKRWTQPTKFFALPAIGVDP